MEDKLVVRIEPDGTLVALSGSGIEEALDLREFGKMTTERAGHIVFDEMTQDWGWRHADGRYGDGGFRTRREAVANEIATLSARL